MRNHKLINKIMNHINDFTDKDLMMTRFDCHGKGLHSVVMYNTFGKLTRMFITTPDHEMYKNMDHDLLLNLGIHDHLYDLTLTGVLGNALNIDFIQNVSDHKTNVKQYIHTSSITGEGGVQLIGDAFLEEYKITRINEEPIKIPHDALHTVYVPKGEIAVWMVEEGEKVKIRNNLYTNSDINTEHCYVEPSYPIQVRTFIEKILTK